MRKSKRQTRYLFKLLVDEWHLLLETESCLLRATLKDVMDDLAVAERHCLGQGRPAVAAPVCYCFGLRNMTSVVKEEDYCRRQSGLAVFSSSSMHALRLSMSARCSGGLPWLSYSSTPPGPRGSLDLLKRLFSSSAFFAQPLSRPTLPGQALEQLAQADHVVGPNSRVYRVVVLSLHPGSVQTLFLQGQTEPCKRQTLFFFLSGICFCIPANIHSIQPPGIT